MRGELESLKNVTVLEPVVTIKSAVGPAQEQALADLADALAADLAKG